MEQNCKYLQTTLASKLKLKLTKPNLSNYDWLIKTLFTIHYY